MATRHSIIEPFPDHIDREAFGHWLSGFCDGEATFMLTESTRGSRENAFAAYLAITLRDDDADALKLIQSFWRCGAFYGYKRKSKESGSRPQSTYHVSKTSNLLAVVIPHFEAFPLRAKKRNDFLIWRRGVELRAEIQGRRGRRRPTSSAKPYSGTFPKWTEADASVFRSLIIQLREQRAYPGDSKQHGTSFEHVSLCDLEENRRVQGTQELLF